MSNMPGMSQAWTTSSKLHPPSYGSNLVARPLLVDRLLRGLGGRTTGTNANAVLQTDGTLKTMPAFAFVAGFMHKWTEALSSNVSYAYGWLDTPPERDPLALQKGGILHANLIWNPVKHLSSGVEYMHGARRTTDDSLGRANRIQFMAKFDF